MVTVTMQGFAPLGALLTGSVATTIGTPEAVAGSAAIVAAVAVLGALSAPTVRRFISESEEPHAQERATTPASPVSPSELPLTVGSEGTRA